MDNRTSSSAGSGNERSPRGGEQPTAGERGQAVALLRTHNIQTLDQCGGIDILVSNAAVNPIGQVEEIGGVVAFLCSEEASYITGETITAKLTLYACSASLLAQKGKKQLTCVREGRDIEELNSLMPQGMNEFPSLFVLNLGRIGLATALALGMRGAHVVVSSRRQANVDKAVALLRTHNIQVTGTTCNVGKGEDREKLIQMTLDQCGGIDILVSNAAINTFFGNILDSTEDDWDKVLSLNVKSAFLLTKLVVPHMEKRGGGNIVFVSSVVAYQPIQGLGPYCVSKTALLGLTKVLAPELAQSNIRVNCVAPGVIKTRFSTILWENEAIMDKFKTQLSIKRIGQVEEIGGVVAFLCSEEASYITGETIMATGGAGSRL
ncbi:Dehydrogenase/reductase SDR family member 4 [Takifugu flavidus]|uniref:Dehydrogenase/reductase SDR family member 4 n=1 Tax=Takifugu flavidus TaxID=433684 RepID=A0A5C6NCN0_9TELE|nr:Dehydrogenase/reductase SDR family member 4 [Takifugu flavidus]